MKFFTLVQHFAWLLFVLMSFTHTACREDFPQEPQQARDQHPPVEVSPNDQYQPDPPEEPYIYFNLPPGWEFHPENHFKAMWPHPSKDQKAPYVLLEFYTLEEAPKADTNNNNESSQSSMPILSAKEKIFKDYNEKLAQCVAALICDHQPQYIEMAIGNAMVYVSESTDIYWSEPTWVSVIAFEKGGKIATFLLQDRAEYYQDALEVIIQSFKTNIDVKGAESIDPGRCPGFLLDQIPVGNFEGFNQSPAADFTIIQNFNTSVDEPTIFAGSKVYGHTGVDLRCKEDQQDQNNTSGSQNETSSDEVSSNNTASSAGQAVTNSNIYSLYPGLVILSQQASYNAHWGEAIVLATRLSADSEQILTHHYYHLDYANADGHHQSSRLHNACAIVQSGDIIAREGASGAWEQHLHVGMHLWHNLAELKKALQNNGRELYGPAYVFDSEEKMAEFLDPECAWHSAEDCVAW